MGIPVSIPKDDDLLPNPWRPVGFTKLYLKQNLDKLRKEIGELKPSDESIKINIAIFGKLQAGKSSFINTVHTAFENYATTPAYVAPSNSSVTSMYTKYKVNDKTCSYFRLCDTRGIETNFGVSLADFKNLVEGHIKENYTFNAKQPIPKTHSMYIPSPAFSDKMHCVCFVFDANKLTHTPAEEYTFVKDFLKNIGQTYKVQFVVLLTHLDKVCKTVQLRPDLIYQSKHVLETVQLVAKQLEINEQLIVPVVNYTRETEARQPFSILALLALRQILRKCKEYYDDHIPTDDHRPTVGSDEVRDRKSIVVRK